MVAVLTRIFGIEHFGLAEDVVQEALARALQTWPFYGVPDNPSAWLIRTARNLAPMPCAGKNRFARKSKRSSPKSIAKAPISETKEAIGGYFMLDVATMDEAVEIARQCPGLPYGVKVEVRPVLGECAMQAEAKREQHLTVAK